MSVHLWLAFAAASAVLLAMPGPTVLLVVAYALSAGRRSAAATVIGVVLGDFTAMTASMVGLGAVLLASATLFGVLKWIGAGYLVFLGVRMWRRPAGGDAAEPEADTTVRPLRMGLHAYVVTALNPKSIVFFLAFLPQFLDAGRPFVEQVVVMEATFLVLAGLNAAGYALMAATAGRAVRRPRVRRIVDRIGGSFLIGAGVLTALTRR